MKTFLSHVVYGIALLVMAATTTAEISEREQRKEFQGKIHEAMEECKGNRVEAARMLNISVQKLKNHIYESPTLRLRWVQDEVSPPDEHLTQMTCQPISVDEERMALAYEFESKRLSRNLHKLPGLTPDQIQIALALRDISGQNFKSGLELGNASLIASIPKVYERISVVEDRLNAVTTALKNEGVEMTEERVALANEEKMLTDSFVELVNTLCKVEARFLDSAKTLALLKQRNKDAKRAKPGYQSIDV